MLTTASDGTTSTTTSHMQFIGRFPELQGRIMRIVKMHLLFSPD